MVRTALVVAFLGCLASGCIVYGPPRRVVVVRENDPPPPPSYDQWPSPSEDPGTTTVVEESPPPVRYEVITESPGVDFVWVWTENDPARLRALAELGVDGIITDFPNRIAR